MANVVAAKAAAAAARAQARAGHGASSPLPLMAAPAEAKPPTSPDHQGADDGDGDESGLRFACDFESGNIGEVTRLNDIEYEISIRPGKGANPGGRHPPAEAYPRPPDPECFHCVAAFASVNSSDERPLPPPFAPSARPFRRPPSLPT